MVDVILSLKIFLSLNQTCQTWEMIDNILFEILEIIRELLLFFFFYFLSKETTLKYEFIDGWFLHLVLRFCGFAVLPLNYKEM